MNPRAYASPSLQSLLVVIGMLGSAPAVLAANTSPVAAPDVVEAHAHQAVLIDLLANDGDADGDPLTVSIATGPGLGSLVDHGDGTVTYTPDPVLFEGAGGDGFSYTVSDGRGGSAGATVTVTETPVPPEARPVPAPTVLFEDDFNSGLGNWTFQDFGLIDGPSNWSVISGELAQTSNIREDGKQKGTYAIAATSGSNYRIKAKLRAQDDDHIGILFRYQNDKNHYRFISSRQGNYRRLEKLVNDEITVLAEDHDPYGISDAWFVEIDAEGSTISLRIDGVPVFSVTDSSFSSGAVGFLSHAMQGAYFDHVEVTPLPQDPAPFLFVDDFEDGDLDGWAITDSGTSSFPSNWQVTNGQLIESGNIAGSVFFGAAGTAALVAAGNRWTDYRFKVQMRAGDDDSMFVLFRFQDWHNHYAFHWNRQSNFRSLRKFVGGQFVDLVSQSGGYNTTETYFVEIVANDDQLEVWVDGDLMLQAVDDTLQSGTVGLGTAAMQSAYFDNVRVTAIP